MPIRAKIRNLFLLLICFFQISLSFAATIDKIIAVVNEEVILQSDLERVLATIEAEYKAIYSNPQILIQRLIEGRENIINQMIEEKLILSEAKKYFLQIDPALIQARLEKIKQPFQTEQRFAEALAGQGLTLKDIQSRFRDQEMMKRAVDYFVRSRIIVDPKEIKLFFEAHKEDFFHPEKVRLRSILINIDEIEGRAAALRKAQLVIEQLNQGQDFAYLAKQYSQGTNAKDGGELGLFEHAELVKEINDAVSQLQPGEFTQPIELGQSLHIFKLESKVPKKRFTFAEAQDLIKNQLFKAKFTERFKEWINTLKQDAYISIKGRAGE